LEVVTDIGKGLGEWEKAVDPYRSNVDLISTMLFAVIAPVSGSD